MNTLFDIVKVNQTVVGKSTGVIYTVWDKDDYAAEHEDAIVLVNHRRTQLKYTRAQFNHHFKPN